MKRNPKYCNRFLKHEISNVSRTPFVVTNKRAANPPCNHNDVHKNSNITQRHLPTTPTGARACYRPHFVASPLLSLPLNLPFLLSLPLFPDYKVTAAVTPPERREHAGTHALRRRCAEGTKGARRPRQGSERSALSASSAPLPRRLSKASAPATPSPSLPRQGSALFAMSMSPPRRRSSPLPPSPSPRATP